jgi:hypothetical protein
MRLIAVVVASCCVLLIRILIISLSVACLHYSLQYLNNATIIQEASTPPLPPALNNIYLYMPSSSLADTHSYI